jgi:hypothetical protein
VKPLLAPAQQMPETKVTDRGGGALRMLASALLAGQRADLDIFPSGIICASFRHSPAEA